MNETIRTHSDLLGQQIYKNAKKKFPSITHIDAVFVSTVKRRKHQILWQDWFTEGRLLLVEQKYFV